MLGVQERLDQSTGGGAMIAYPPSERGERGSVAIIIKDGGRRRLGVEDPVDAVGLGRVRRLP